jgi:hypothetical protein
MIIKVVVVKGGVGNGEMNCAEMSTKQAKEATTDRDFLSKLPPDHHLRSFDNDK